MKDTATSMPLNQGPLSENQVPRRGRYQNWMCAFCIIFGVAVMANTHTAADGGWFWYATLLRDGKRLYADMHLALQPLFVLETAWLLGLLGKGWLVSKVPALLHLVAYSVGLLLVARSSNLSDRSKALVLGCAFFLSISFDAYRFDDYHVLADCFEVYSLVLLIKLPSINRQRGLIVTAGLGILSGLAITTRLNDGAALVLGTVIAIVCLARSRRLLSIVVFGVAAALTVVSIVHLTGDTLHNYAMYSIFQAAGSKGGAGNVLAYPLQLPINALLWFRNPWYAELLVYSLAVPPVLVYLVQPLWRTRKPGQFNRTTFAKGMLGLPIILLPLRYFFVAIFVGDFILSLSAAGTVAAYVLGGVVVVRWIRKRLWPDLHPQYDPREVLLIIPLGQLMSAAMSSGGQHRGLYAPLAIIILLLPIASPIAIKRETTASMLLIFTTLLLGLGLVRKAAVPFVWHSYQARPLFLGRQWYRHPVYGPMIIETDQLAFIEPVCTRIATTGSQPELLSLPFPYANYFCSTPPWRGYVQTFFDTSSKQTISGLMDDLQKLPPEWILYQRQLDNMTLHERIFNHGNPLPHRDLDRMIEQNLSSGKWQAAYTSSYADKAGLSNQWILIRTRADSTRVPTTPP